MTDENRPLVVLAGVDETDCPAWAAALIDAEGDYAVAVYSERGRYVARLADDGAALVIADGDGADWGYWTTTPKSSPATRRVPIVIVSEDADRRAEGLTAGADFALVPDTIMKDLPALLKEHARVPDPALAEQLDCECGAALPELARQGVEKFNAGEYYKQHDLFEALWMETEGPVRDLYRAILQVGVAYFQIVRGNHRGAHKMLLRSVQWLAALPDVCQGIDVAALKADSARVRAELERLPEDAIGQFDRSLLQPVKYVE